jgi:uncharacterized radical SAM superfamily Fe-S cluster-containing enzyme
MTKKTLKDEIAELEALVKNGYENLDDERRVLRMARIVVAEKALKIINELQEENQLINELRQAGFVVNENLRAENQQLKEKLEVAVESLKEIATDHYPTSIFPDLTENECVEINKFFLEKFNFPIDRLSAFLLRSHHKVVREEIEKLLKQLTQNSPNQN